MLNPLRWTLNKFRLFLTIFIILSLTAGCSIPAASTPTPDLFATLQASTPLTISSPAPVEVTATPNFSFATAIPTSLSVSAQTSIPSPSSADQPTGHIVFTCQIFKVQASNQICIMNADGSGYRRLTTDDSRQHFYPSLAPDGQSVVYSAFYATNNYEIYELDLNDGSVDRLTNTLGVETAPEVSPDGSRITFTRIPPNKDQYQIILMDRNGKNMGNIPGIFGWDPTWSPDGKQILFASDRSDPPQLYSIRTDGKNMQRLSNLPAIRGRSDWSADGQFIVTYSGPSWNREVYIMNADGSNARQLTPTGGNSQGPSISPDGKWVAFTAYFDNYGDDHGCEIYIIRVDGTDLRRLTNNDYCDYQPRWGP
jgi:tol-pal system beta propeller repeat protein TolB